MRGRIIELEVTDKRGKAAKTIPLYQYDYGQKLLIKGVELPEYYEVHFSNQQYGDAVTVLGDSTGVLIPDSLVATGETIYVWLFLHDTSYDGETEYMGAIPVIKRAQPTDVTPTPEEQSIITEVIAALNNMEDDMSEQVQAAESAKEAARTAQTAAEGAATTASGYVDTVTAAQSAAEAAQAAAETAATSATASATSATNSANNANNALAEATNAKIVAVDAANSASTSATTATTASGNAANSAVSAESAKVDAVAAKVAAEAAQTAAETAQGKAEDAQGAAETAQGKAEDAQTAAETAQGKAEDAQAAAESAQGSAEDSAEDSEAYAVGTRNGVDVESDDPAYENNAKYYAEEAAAVLEDKLDAPATAGTAGQVLTSDGEGGQAWADPSGAIDDTAGEGDTDLTWSADKLDEEFTDVKTAIHQIEVSKTQYNHEGLSKEEKVIKVDSGIYENNPYVFLGKNYFPTIDYVNSNPGNTNGISFATDGAEIHMYGTASSSNGFWLKPSKDSSNVYWDLPSGIEEGDTMKLYVFAKRSADYNTPYIGIQIFNQSKTKLLETSLRVDKNNIINQSSTITIPAGAYYVIFRFMFDNAQTYDNYFVPVLVKEATEIINNVPFVNNHAEITTNNETDVIFTAPYKSMVDNNMLIKDIIIKHEGNENEIKNIIIPEMFGAYGDSLHDDTEALQKCITYGKNNNMFVVCGGYYVIGKPLYINGDYQKVSIKRIECKSTDAAIVITGRYNKVEVNTIITSGAGVRIHSTSETTYNTIILGRIYAEKNAIELIEGSSHILCNSFRFDNLRCGDNYASIYQSPYDANYQAYHNNNNFVGGRLTGGKWGVQNAKPQDTYLTCMFEDTDNCVLIDSKGPARIISPRYVEVYQQAYNKETGLIVPNKGLICAIRPSYDIVPKNMQEGRDFFFSIEGSSGYIFTQNIDITSVPYRYYDEDNNVQPVSKNTPPPMAVYLELHTRQGYAVAPKFYLFANHILIKDPYYKMTKHIESTDSGYTGDYRTTNDDMEFIIYDRYIIDDASCDYTLPPSYDVAAYNKFYVEQHSGNTCILRDWRGTAVFNGSDYGDGIYEVTIELAENQMGDDYYNTNQRWVIRDVSTGEVEDTMPHST